MSRITFDVSKVVEQLRFGNVAALPTETVYGLAADATNENAVKKVFDTKQRPINHPLIMHVAPDWDLNEVVESIPEYAKLLIKKFWPGPLTFVFKLKKQTKVSHLVTGNQDTIAIRCPSHPKALEVLQQLGRPFVAPSANPFGKISPTDAEHVLHDFPEDDFLILDGGVSNVGIESTIISCLKDEGCSILRHGVIGRSDLESICNVIEHIDSDKNIRISGNLKTHYQPRKPLYYFQKDSADLIKNTFLNKNHSYLLCFTSIFDKEHANYTFPDCPKQAARELYRQLRLADSSNKEVILIELPPEKSEWQGVLEKIHKAGSLLTSI